MKRIIIFLCLLSSVFCLSQSLPIAPEFERAYENGTRSKDGKPGKNYWQNKSIYNIDVTLDTKMNMIWGSGTIVYKNNSPDNLDRLVFRLYPNIDKKTAKRDSPPSDNYDFTDGLIIDELEIGGKTVNPNGNEAELTGTNLIIKGLNIAPGSQTELKMKWHYRISRTSSRTGVYDRTNYFIAYWYPQISVYDDIDGWDMTEYTGTLEFYNDFNDYDVRITVPNNYLVWATGELQNADKILAPHIYERWREAHNSKETVHIISEQDYLLRMLRLNADSETNTWIFKASNVTDFTFAGSDKFLWDGRAAYKFGENDIRNNLAANPMVFVSAAYSDKSTTFKEMADISAVTIERMSKEMPGVPFPFPCLTVFNGAGGMESPMMVNQGSSSQRIWTIYTAVHEVAHSYFPFYMGINERKYAWMDEGQAQMLMEYIEWGLDTSINFREYNTARYIDYAGRHDEEPLMTDSRVTPLSAYGSTAYFKPAAAYNILMDFLGQELFNKCMQEYMRRWNGKHPIPYDYFNTFNDVSGQDLNWFFIPWFFEKGAPDLSLKSVNWTDGKIKISVERKGIIPIPIHILIITESGENITQSFPPSIWKDGNKDFTFEYVYGGNINSVKLGNKQIPDMNLKDNFMKMKQ